MGIAVQGGQIVVQYQNCDLDTKTTSKVQSSLNFTRYHKSRHCVNSLIILVRPVILLLILLLVMSSRTGN